MVLSFNYRGLWLLETLAAVVIIRLGYNLINNAGSFTGTSHYRNSLRRAVVDESIISTLFVATTFMMGWPLNRLSAGGFVITNLVLQIGTLFGSRVIMRQLPEQLKSVRKTLSQKKVLIIGTGIKAREVTDMIVDSPELSTSIIGFLDYRKTGLWSYRESPLMGHPDRFEDIVLTNQVDAVFIAVEPEDFSKTQHIFNIAEEMGVTVCVMPGFYDTSLTAPRPTVIKDKPALVYRRLPENRLAVIGKSLMDKTGALLGLLVASPVWLVTALFIKLESRGPVLFRQLRSGLNGKPFEVLKFRTMCCDAEEKKASLKHYNEMSGPVFKIKKDPRVTRVGRFLRKYSIDEIPQFVNVLKGEMSLVGPRPPLPGEVALYKPWHHRKLSVKPGLTCLWQVNGRNNIDFEEWMKLDLEYIDKWSLWLDAKIIVKTFPAVLKGSGS